MALLLCEVIPAIVIRVSSYVCFLMQMTEITQNTDTADQNDYWGHTRTGTFGLGGVVTFLPEKLTQFPNA